MVLMCICGGIGIHTSLRGWHFAGSSPARYTMCEYCIIGNILDFQSNVGGSNPPIRSNENKDFINKWIG